MDALSLSLAGVLRIHRHTLTLPTNINETYFDVAVAGGSNSVKEFDEMNN
jgi:hypothetical protein